MVDFKPKSVFAYIVLAICLLFREVLSIIMNTNFSIILYIKKYSFLFFFFFNNCEVF